MPHQCTNCDRRFPDGSKEMLSGCPDCGGNKFQFAPATSEASDDASSGEATPATESKQPADATATADQDPASASATSGQAPDREWPETARRPAEKDGRLDGSFADESPAEAGTDAMADDFEWVNGEEDDAQATARSDVVSPDELPRTATDTEAVSSRTEGATTDASDGTRETDARDRPDDGRVVSEPETDQPSIDQLREELNQQFESIKIVNPGQYELNLMELYDREEHIVSLQEDGRYVINVPESWHDS
ncbi:hypothetical protein C479_09098 [Halovivax asiaticus JCM 14624]|uniref:Zn-ribbon containing protein (DUF2072) n=1 Tax=Halovivax asiaticus JCM 14624 TaxID=1227490 RepID=M0BJC6_9EURY|nr:Zn-ribbon containing protein [Halovivax asiaticus]ELZ10955.1 hypothetical protein C479_09098 [Halovivax asiaticus JCM 14624]